MNTIKNNDFTIRPKTRQILYASVHPVGGFVALPDGRTTRIGQRILTTSGRCVDRKGFVAWPARA